VRLAAAWCLESRSASGIYHASIVFKNDSGKRCSFKKLCRFLSRFTHKTIMKLSNLMTLH